MRRRTAGLALLALGLAGAACTVARTAPPRTADDLTAHLREIGVTPDRSLRLSPRALDAARGTGVGLPRLQVFDRSGALIHEEDGYTLGLAGRLERALAAPQPLAPGRTLATETADVETLDGAPAELATGGADFVFVDHWAMWCPPCRPQARALQRFLADHPARRIRLVLVDWDEAAAAE